MEATTSSSVPLRPELVANALRGRREDALNRLTSSFSQIEEAVRAVAENVAVLDGEGGAEGRLGQLRGLFAQAAELSHEAELQAASLAAVESGFQATVQPHNWAQALDGASKRQRTADKFDADTCGKVVQFEHDFELASANPAAGNDSDDDVVIEGGQVQMNAKCPISGKPLMELEEPVEDSKGYVYEKKEMLAFFKQKRADAVECPIAGAKHMVTKAELKPCVRIRRQQKRARLAAAEAGPSQPSKQQANVLDADDDDE